MAAPLCMSNDGKPAVFIGTFLEKGDSVTLCEDCLPDFTSAITASMNGIPPEVFAGVVDQLRQAAEDGEGPAPAEMAAPPDMPADRNGKPAVDGQMTVDEAIAGVEHGAPSDEPPAPAPADIDPDMSPPEVPEAAQGAENGSHAAVK